jgi:hypothetical protein
MFCAATVAVTAPAAIAAPVYTLDTGASSTTSCSGSAGTCFTFGSGADKINVHASGWTLSSDTKSIASASLGVWDAGMGVTSSGDYNGNYNLHAIDNLGSYDFVVLQFDKSVQLQSFGVTPYEIGNYGYVDSDVSFGSANSAAAWNSNPFSSGNSSQLFNIIPLNSFTTNNTTSNSARTVTASGTGNFWVVAARLGTNDNEYDNFKLDKIKFTASPQAVPEPATWAMMILGMGAVGASLRRRKNSLAASLLAA